MSEVDNALELSDEEFLANPLLLEDEVIEEPEVEEDEVVDADDSAEESVEEADEPVTEEDEEDIVVDEAEEADDEVSEEEVAEDDAEDVEADDGLSPDDDEAEEEVDGEEDKESDESTDFETFYKEITAPFKANGKMMQVDKAEDAIKLMQMGANYNRKMGALKPQLKVLRMLENHELLDEGKLSFLIDLNKKDPAAINQLLKDSNIDPMEINLDEGQTYQRTDYSVDDKVLDLDSVVEELQDSDLFQPVLNVVTKEWDAESKQIVADQPELLRVIHDHMASGVYDLVSTEVEKERMFGRLSNVSDLEAYRLIGDSLNEKGAFDHLFAPAAEEQPATKVAPKPSSKSRSSKAEEQKRREKRRAASPTKRAAKGKSEDDFNPLNMSDDEFQKQFDPRFS